MANTKTKGTQKTPNTTAVVATPEVKNEAKKDAVLTIQEVTKLYAEAGIKCFNPEAKGNYRIMGSKKGSSLNVKPQKGYFIYTSGADFDLIKGAGVKRDDLVLEEGANSQDSSRPNVVICKTVETLKTLLALYAQNPVNAIPVVAEK